jgi:hypothetical protein
VDSSIVIPERFRGPPKSGNGGYVTGVLAGLLTEQRFDLPQLAAAEVTLRAPVPLDRALHCERTDTQLRALDGERLIAEAALTTLDMRVPEPPSWDDALAARPHSDALRVGRHAFFIGERVGFHPICFCCGAELAADAGLHVYPAAIAGRAQVAAAWVAPSHFADADGTLGAPILCTALDCPGQFAWLAEGTRTGMLGRLTPRIEKPVRAGERCVVIGWTLGQEGRKFYAGTALFNEQRELCAYAKAVWIGRVPEPAAEPGARYQDNNG